MRIQSPAFQRAALESELQRTLGLLCLLGALTLYVIARGFSGGFQLWLGQVFAIVLTLAYEVFMLALVKRALDDDREIPQSVWITNVLIESQLPTVAIVLLIANQVLTPYQALVAPALLVYLLFIILSTLRLNPGLSILTGLASALGYLFVTIYALTNPQEGTTATFHTSIYFVYAALLLIGGIISAVVASQIRNHVVAALREAQLQNELKQFKHDLDIARSIQQGLLPSQPPALEGFELAGWNQPADQTGGDYFDWEALPDGRIAISLGDATGHGIGPALVSASCRAYARASFLSGNGSGELLDRLNRLLAKDLSANRFVTFCVTFLQPADGEFQVLSAGHGPILWYKYADDKIENLEAQGIPLGMIAGVPYAEATNRCLAVGDMLAVVTDGCYEWENPEGEQFGIERLESVIHASRDASAEEVISRLRSAVMDFCKGTEQKDDLTAVVLKRKSDSSSTVKVRLPLEPNRVP